MVSSKFFIILLFWLKGNYTVAQKVGVSDPTHLNLTLYQQDPEKHVLTQKHMFLSLFRGSSGSYLRYSKLLYVILKVKVESISHDSLLS